MSVEPDNIIQNADNSGVSSEGERSVILNGAIDFGNDVDLYLFQADAGEEVSLDIDANESGSALDARLRLFDSLGNEIGNNDDRPAPGEASSLDPFISFTPASSNDYYVGVSNVSNSDYDPNVVSDEASIQVVIGEYALEISLADENSSSDSDNIIAGAIVTSLDAPGQSVSFTDEIDNVADVDLYQVQLDSGDALVVNVDAGAIDSDLFASDLRIFDSEGSDLGDLATIDDSRLSKDSSASRIGGDPDLTFIAESAGDYYIGVSGGGFEAPTYNPINGINSGDSVASGAYEINFDILTVGADEDPDNTISEAIIIEDNLDTSTVVRDRIDNGDDVDLVRVQLDAGETVNLDIDTLSESLESDLALRLFDVDGDELATADDDFDSENAPSFDPILTFTAETTGDYYVGVAFAENSDYDPVAGTSNLPQQNEAGGGNYDLKIAIDVDETVIDPNIDADGTIANATALELLELGDEITLDEEIDTDKDIDLYQVELEAGEVLTFDIDTEAESDLRLRLFNTAGNELESSDDDAASEEEPSSDPFLSFTANIAGDYYVGVSEFSNSDYDPITGIPVDDAVDIAGAYTLEATLSMEDSEEPQPGSSTEEQDNTIAQAIATGLNDIGQSASFSNAIEPIEDVDLYQVQLEAGEGLVVDIDAAELLPPEESASGLDSLLRLFDRDGNQIAIADDASAPGEEFSLDSFLTFTASSSGDYYVGVSSLANADYNPLTGNSPNLGGGNTGEYNLSIDLVEVVAIDRDTDNTIEEAILTDIGSAGTATFNDAIEPETDADLYQVQLEAGDNLLLDLDANELGSDLDARLRLFDAAGNELLSVDDAPAPGEEFGLDAFIEFTAEIAGSYYVGVSDFSNAQYDPNNGITNLSEPIGTTTGDYELNIEIANDAVKPVFADFERIEGTDNPDVLFGNANSTFIDALDGDDVVTGAGNSDYFVGGAGSDILSGNNGDDTLLGGVGFDFLSGGEGNDFLQGDEDSNTLLGGAGADIFAIAERGNNTIADFESGIDTIQLLGSLSFADLILEEIAGGSGVVISSSSSTSITTMPGINASNLSAADFLTS